MGKRYGIVCGKLINTENVSERLLRLPIYHEMTHKEVEQIWKCIELFYRESLEKQ
jgi:dTDP-4-amino-4,6-dideoxygalactose transaminase